MVCSGDNVRYSVFVFVWCVVVTVSDHKIWCVCVVCSGDNFRSSVFVWCVVVTRSGVFVWCVVVTMSDVVCLCRV